jgi:membrane protein
LSAALSALSGWVEAHVSEAFLIVFKVLDILVSIGVVTVLFAAIFKFLPDAKIIWRDVWHGAVMTSILFVIAKFLLGLYFGNSDPGSTYGAAGSIILIMLWVNYAGLILLFGAEFTQVYARAHGRNVQPTKGAESTQGEGDNGAIVNKKTEAQTKKAGSGLDRKPEPRAARQSDRQVNINKVTTGKRKPKVSFGQFLAGYIIHKVRGK